MQISIIFIRLILKNIYKIKLAIICYIHITKFDENSNKNCLASSIQTLKYLLLYSVIKQRFKIFVKFECPGW